MKADSDVYDLVVLGGGSAGETAAARVGAAGRRVAIIEARLVGGECPYWGCVPSKALLIAATRRRQIQKAPELGATAGAIDIGSTPEAWQQAVRMRDERARHQDDSEAVAELEKQGVEIIRGRGEITEPGVVEVDGRPLRYRHLLISVGADATVPPIPGLRETDPWTSDDALTNSALPRSLVIVGGGAIGVELAQVYSTFGAEVTIVEALDRLLALEEPEVSRAVLDVLDETGVKVSLGVGIESVGSSPDGTALHLADGSTVTGEQVLVATGRRPRLEGYGLERLGIDTESGAIGVDADGRVPGLSNVYAAGDVTGAFPFTHTANYAGRVIASNVLGVDARMHLDAVPRAVFIDPPVAGVGLTTSRAEEQELEVVRTTMDVGTTARGWLENEGGVVVLVADRGTRTLVGASAIGPRADEWISQVTLAIRARVPIEVLVDTIQPFPAVSEALFPAYESMLAELG
jgi:dihydrolipoamide dehydrogenase